MTTGESPAKKPNQSCHVCTASDRRRSRARARARVETSTVARDVDGDIARSVATMRALLARAVEDVDGDDVDGDIARGLTSTTRIAAFVAARGAR